MNNYSIDLIQHQIRTEIKIDSEGKGVCSFRGVARLCGVSISTMLEHFSKDRKKDSKLVVTLEANGFEVITFSSFGIPDLAVACIIEYYAYDAGQRCTPEAMQCIRAFLRIGVRAWMRDITGWERTKPEETNIKLFLNEQMPEKALPWEMRFPPEFWLALNRVYGLTRGQRACSGFINNYVYSYFPREVRDRLDELNPKNEDGYRARKQHQHFDDVLLKALKMQVSLITQTLISSSSRAEFRKKMKSLKRYKFTPDNLQQIKGGAA